MFFLLFLMNHCPFAKIVEFLTALCPASGPMLQYLLASSESRAQLLAILIHLIFKYEKAEKAAKAVEAEKAAEAEDVAKAAAEKDARKAKRATAAAAKKVAAKRVAAKKEKTAADAVAAAEAVAADAAEGRKAAETAAANRRSKDEVRARYAALKRKLQDAPAATGSKKADLKSPSKAGGAGRKIPGGMHTKLTSRKGLAKLVFAITVEVLSRGAGAEDLTMSTFRNILSRMDVDETQQVALASEFVDKVASSLDMVTEK